MDAAGDIQAQNMHLPARAKNDLCSLRVTADVEFRFRILNIKRTTHDDHFASERDDVRVQTDRKREIRHGTQREKRNLPGMSMNGMDDQVCSEIIHGSGIPGQRLSIVRLPAFKPGSICNERSISTKTGWDIFPAQPGKQTVEIQSCVLQGYVTKDGTCANNVN